MAFSGSGLASGAMSGASLGSSFGPYGAIIGGVAGGALGAFSGKKKGADGGAAGAQAGPSIEDLLALIDRYSYQPQYTGQTEKQLYDLFGQLTGTSGGGTEAIPFQLGRETTGLYDSLTRGISEDYLGTPGGPEGGRIADIRAYYNNAGIPEAAINQERLANRDLNNSLLDAAAQVNNTYKDRLLNILNIGSGVGTNLYSQNLAQHRANAGLAMNAAGLDIGVQDSIRQANQSSLTDLLGGLGSVVGSNLGNQSSGGGGILNLGGSGQVNRGGGGLMSLFSNFGGSSSAPNGGTNAKLI